MESSTVPAVAEFFVPPVATATAVSPAVLNGRIKATPTIAGVVVPLFATIAESVAAPQTFQAS